ncbi:ceramide kinase-like [Corticium candelabrum]|uniref:ceramide kinase-like n=1 Tax=Corticium candelabrum TaxID=121492 RepID=UPI002E2658A1|nr:ceramide kinase-like [Corticium candelabrum]
MAFAESVPIRDPDKGNLSSLPESLIQSILTHAGKQQLVSLTANRLSWSRDTATYSRNDLLRNDHDVHCVNMCDIIAVHPTYRGHWNVHNTTSNHHAKSTEFTAFTFSRMAGRKWNLRKLTFQCPSTEMCRQWLEHLYRLLEGMRHRPKYLKVFINPVGGARKAQKIYDEKVRPLWELAGIRTDITVTRDAEHAPAAVRDLDIRRYDGIICVGGDGLFNRVANSLLMQTQLEAGVDLSRPRFIPARPRAKLGIIPAGTTDALCYTTTGTQHAETSAIRIALGDTRGVDVLSLQHKNQLLCFGVSISYGFLGDLLEQSESMRWLGPKRYTFAGFMKFMSLRSYPCEVSFTESSKQEVHPRDNTACKSSCTVCSSSLDAEVLPSSPSEKGAMARAGDNEIITAQDPSAWTKVLGHYIGVQAFTTAAACKQCHMGMSPSAHLGDGYADLVLVQSCSRVNYLRLLKRIKGTGDQFALPFVSVHRVEEIRVRPLQDVTQNSESTDSHTSQERVTETDTRQGRRRHSLWNVDGEIVSQPEVDIRVHRQLLTLFTRGLEQEDDNDSHSL